MSDIHFWTLRVDALTQSVDWWNMAIVWTLAAAALVATVAGITTGIAFSKSKELNNAQSKLSEAKESQLALDLRAKDLDIENSRKKVLELSGKLIDASIPRSLDAGARERIGDKLPRRSNGGQVHVMYLPWTFDGLPLARQILGALEKVGIRNGPEGDVTSLEDGIPVGFAFRPLQMFSGIQVMHTSDPRSLIFASALATALRDEHLEEVHILPGLTIFSDLPADSELRTKVIVRIGRKP